MQPASIPRTSDEPPDLCGHEEAVARALAQAGPVDLTDSGIDFDGVQSCFAIALHMHQPLIPASSDDLRNARVISNLQHMMEHQKVGDNHNAPIFRWCYKRMGEFIPQLVRQGKQPRVMLDYSGCLLHGLMLMGAGDVLEALRSITCEADYRPCVEWLGSAWGHPVAPSTPVQDYRLHVRAWQHHFAAIFGAEALRRVRGFSPAEMALPNHPDVAYEFVKTLRECGYQWLLVQEHSVEPAGGGRTGVNPHLPHRLAARNSRGQVASIVAIIKTQGSDTKLVGQMQPYSEAMGLGRTDLAGKVVPQLAMQIADGENGGVMMNEFPHKFLEAMSQASGSQTAPMNVSEFLAYLQTIGVREEDLPAIQPVQQNKIWNRFEDGAGPEALAQLIGQLQKEDGRFHMEGGSWTNNISWVRGYDRLLGPMEAASAMFAQKVLARNVPTSDPRYRNALYHLLMTQTSCFRYWGSGVWVDYGRELCRRTTEILVHDF